MGPYVGTNPIHNRAYNTWIATPFEGVPEGRKRDTAAFLISVCFSAPQTIPSSDAITSRLRRTFAASASSSRATLPLMPELREVPDSPPPFLGSWRRVYIAVLVYLAGVILAAYFFSRAYR